MHWKSLVFLRTSSLRRAAQLTTLLLTLEGPLLPGLQLGMICTWCLVSTLGPQHGGSKQSSTAFVKRNFRAPRQLPAQSLW